MPRSGDCDRRLGRSLHAIRLLTRWQHPTTGPQHAPSSDELTRVRMEARSERASIGNENGGRRHGGAGLD